MDKINPMLYVVDTDPVPENVLEASKWFETEYQTFDYDYGTNLVSSPNDTNYIQWFMAQGWTVYDKTVTPIATGVFRATYFLRRRKLQSERVLNDMIKEFTDAYNEGRAINDRRYDEIVTIYNVMLDKSQDELNSLSTATASYNTLIGTIIGKIETDFNTFNTAVGSLGTDYADARRTDINTRFDNELSKARQSLIERGLNNSTVWASVSAGIERERERALSDVEDKIVDRRLGLAAKIHEARESMRSKMLSAHERLMATKREDALVPLDFRNKVLSAMLNFMERREDDYPGLDGLAGIASQLGFSEGAAVVAP